MKRYLKPIPPNINRIKLDVGLSYNAPESQIWLEHDKDLFVFGFEPNEDNIKSIESGNIQKRHPMHGDPISTENFERFCLIPVALSNVETETEMDFYEMEQDSGSSSLNRPICPLLGGVKTVRKVPVFSLKHFFEEFDWERFPFIEYLKIDAQGSDLDILKSAGDYLRERVVYVTAEPEMYAYEGVVENSLDNISIYMHQQGFVRIQHPNTVDPTYYNVSLSMCSENIFINQSS